jgi:hypothetical protein
MQFGQVTMGHIIRQVLKTLPAANYLNTSKLQNSEVRDIIIEKG